MKEDIRISIIIPVYQVENYIEKCIQSVCRQTYKNLEIILVDDCSKDRSGDICDDYAKMDTRVRVIHQPSNRGISAARNIGMSQATGEYYMFVDSDDWVGETLCENAISALLSGGGRNRYGTLGILLCGRSRKDINGRKSGSIPERKNIATGDF